MFLKKSMRTLFVLFILAGFVLIGSFAVAEDEEASLKEKAASQLIDSMPDFFKDVIALQKMTPHEKIDYVLTQSEGRIQEKVAEKFQEDMEGALTAYAKDAFRAKAFVDQAVPKIRSAYAIGESFDWTKIDAEISSTVDTKINAFGKAISAAKIGWGAYAAYGEGGSLAAFQSVSSEVSTALAEAYIPGWGAIKLGAEMVQILGRYVLDYATDTALEGMLNDMYSMKSNPQGLAQWLVDKSPAGINKDVADKWNDGMGYGRLWEGQGTDKGDEAMQGRIRDTLLALRGEILVKKKSEEQKQEQLMSKVNEYLQKAKDSEEKVKVMAKKVRDAAQVNTDKIREFRSKVMGISKTVAASKIAASQGDFQAAGQAAAKYGTENGVYRPIDRSTVLAALDTALSHIQESGSGGYDQEEYVADILRYREKRNAALAASTPVSDIFRRQYNADVATLTAAENVLRIEAQERLVKRFEPMYAGITRLQHDVGAANVMYFQQTEEFRKEVANKLHQPYIWRTTAESLPDYAAKGDTFAAPGDVSLEFDKLQALKKDLLEDQSAVTGLHEKEKKLIEEYIQKVDAIRKDYEELIPSALLFKTGPSTGQKDVQETLDMREFYPEEANVGGGMLKPPAYTGISLPAMYDITLEEHQKKIAQNPLALLPKNLQNLDARLSFLNNIVPADEMVRVFMTLNERVRLVPVIAASQQRDLAQEKVFLADIFNTRDGMSGQFRHVDLTEGTSYLKQLQAAWAEQGLVIEKMDKLRKGIGKQVRYSFDFYNTHYAQLDRWLLIPEKIQIAEEEQKKSRVLTDTRLGLADKYLAEWRAKMAELVSSGITQPAEIKKLLGYVTNQAQLLTTWGAHPDVVKRLKASQDFQTELQAQLKLAEEAGKVAKAAAQQRAQEWQAQAAAEQKKKAEEEAKKKEEEARRGGPVMVMYALSNPRLNTVSLRNASGEVVVSRSDLKDGTLEVTARLNTLQKITTILVSEDGMTWKELPLSLDLTFSFVPISGKPYAPKVRIKTTDFYNMDFAFFDNIRSIVYQDVDYNQLVETTVRKIAEAYERADITAFSQLISRDYLGNKSTLEEGVRFDFDMFTGIKLTIYIDRIERRGIQFVADTKWDKDQLPRKTGLQQKTSGRTTMTFVLEDGQLKITNLRGNLIYATLSPEIAQASGLPSATVEAIRTAEAARNPEQPGSAVTEDAGGVTTTAAEDENVITVTSPNGGESWVAQTTHNITWTSTGISNVHIEYKIAAGAWNDVVASTPASAGSYSWDIPWMMTNVVLVRITAVEDSAITDMSDSTFTVTEF